MSGYDFFSGFLGSLGQQMQQKKQQKLAVEEEERQYQRALSREEALAKSRERIAIAAEERRMRAQPPEMRQYVDENTGKLMQAEQRFNPETQKFETFGKSAEVKPTVARTIDVDGQTIDIMTDGTRVVLGESPTGMRTRSADSRAAASNALRKMEIERRPPRQSGSLDAESRRVTRAAVRDATSDDEARRRGIFKAYGLDPETGTVEQLRQAVDNDVRGIKPEPKSNMPGFTELFMDGTEAKIPSSAKPEPTETYAEFADDIASARKRYAGGSDATEDEIIEALIYEGKLRRNSDGRLSKN